MRSATPGQEEKLLDGACGGKKVKPGACLAPCFFVNLHVRFTPGFRVPVQMFFAGWCFEIPT